MPTYLTVDLEIGPQSGGEYPVVIRSPAGEARFALSFPAAAPALEEIRATVRAALSPSAALPTEERLRAEQAVRAFGQRLFEALLSGNARSLFDVSRFKATHEGHAGLRVRLRLLAPELVAFPWEYLYDPLQGEYVSLSRTTPLVRYLEVAHPIAPLTVAPPLRMLVMAASPIDQAPLDLAQERQRLERALQPLVERDLIELTWLSGGTRRALQQAMREGSWHLFHFIGHAAFEPQRAESLLALEREDGTTHLVQASDLATVLAEQQTLQLVLLNACQGATGSNHALFTSSAALLVQRGIPSVVAMQADISDQAAIEFTRTFYEALGQGLPVDAAMAEARLAMRGELSRSLEWGTPVLYLRSPDGALFQFDQPIPTLRCPQCAAPLPLAARFCGRCGLELRPASAVVLAAARLDADMTQQVQADLADQGISVVGAQGEVQAERGAIREAPAVIILASPHARHSRAVQEAIKLAKMYQRPLFPLWLGGEWEAEVLPPEWEGLPLVDARGTRYAAGLVQLTTALRPLVEQKVVPPPSPPPPPIEPRNPYKGLRAFRSEDHHDFFGREALVDELAQALLRALNSETQQRRAARLLAVVGPSGSGKSSVVMAGLLPKLQAGALPGSAEWIYLEPIIPGAHPLASLAQILWKRLSDKSLRAIREDLESDSVEDALHTLTSLLPKRPEAKVVVLIDQFEELFTQAIDEHERRRFIDLLVTAVAEPHGPVIVLLTLRADFYDRPMQYPDLARLIQAQHRPVLQMEVEDLRAVIEGPAVLEDVQLSFEGALVGDLLFEIQGQLGALPLLQFTLDQLFQRRDGHQLTLAAYREIGGVKGALKEHAEATYANLPSDDHRAMARALFRRLVDPGTTEQDTTRRRAALKELVLPDPTQTQIMQETAQAFVAAHLLVTNEVGGVTTVEVSHEALIREWPRLAEWLHEARDDIHFQRRLSENVAEWLRYNKSPDGLYQGARVDEALDWVERSMPNAEEMAFIQASVEERDRLVTLRIQEAVERERQAAERERQAAELAQQKREIDLQRRVVRRQRVAIGAGGVAAIVIVIALLVTVVLGQQVISANTKLLHSLPVDVTNTNDDGPGSLRQAIHDAQPGAAITFATTVTGTIRLKRELEITKSLQISGPGASLLKILPADPVAHPSRLFNIHKNVVATIANVTIAGGVDTTDCITNPNSALCGGGNILNAGALTLINTRITGGEAFNGYGGGILCFYSGQLTIANSTISGNKAAAGGGIASLGPLTISNSTISDNEVSDSGGGIDAGDLLSLTNSTITGNSADNGDGGGIINTSGSTVILTYSTIYKNQAPNGGGGGFANSSDVTNPDVRLFASIVADNQAQSGPDLLGTATLHSRNIIQDPSGANLPVDPNDGVALNPVPSLIFSSLGDFGGPTQTLQPPAPAVDQISADGIICGPGSPYETDQRGKPRPDDNEGMCDIGAYESAA